MRFLIGYTGILTDIESEMKKKIDMLVGSEGIDRVHV